jgi:hypothetical protein
MRKVTLLSIKAESESRSNLLAPRCTDCADERGWALLGLILALSVMGIMLAAIVPNVSFQVRRDKEAELLYRGEQMAKAISRYYNNGRLGAINVLQCPQPRGCLLELEKLKEPYLVGVNEIKLVRLSATIDPMNNGEWEPVRLRDPRLLAVLQAYAAETGLVVPQIYAVMAGPPAPLIRPPSDTTTPPPAGGNTQGGNTQGGNTQGGNTQGGSTQGGDPGGDPGDPVDPPDPLARFFDGGSSGPGLSNVPIIGVAPKMKGSSVRTLYGLPNYEEWVFIFIPPISHTTGAGGNPGAGTNDKR